MSSNDQMNTKPTIETVLERIESLRQEFRSEMRDLRMEMAQGFHKLERKLGAHGSLVMDLLEDRVEKLESKVC